MRAVIEATVIAVIVWVLITAAGVLSYVYVGQRCADGLKCLGPMP